MLGRKLRADFHLYEHRDQLLRVHAADAVLRGVTVLVLDSSERDAFDCAIAISEETSHPCLNCPTPSFFVEY
jgi:hypothetical protein